MTNTKRFLVAAGLGALLPLFAATAASAAGSPSGTVTAVTHTSNHADTTSVSGPCTVNSGNGPVWAYDNLSLNLNSVPNGGGNYTVTVTAHGSFAAVADPITGACSTGNGSVNGWIDYAVSSATAPDPANVPAQEPGNVGQSAIVKQLFGRSATVVGGSYSYTYTLVDGTKYVQHS